MCQTRDGMNPSSDLDGLGSKPNSKGLNVFDPVNFTINRSMSRFLSTQNSVKLGNKTQSS